MKKRIFHDLSTKEALSKEYIETNEREGIKKLLEAKAELMKKPVYPSYDDYRRAGGTAYERQVQWGWSTSSRNEFSQMSFDAAAYTPPSPLLVPRSVAETIVPSDLYNDYLIRVRGDTRISEPIPPIEDNPYRGVAGVAQDTLPRTISEERAISLRDRLRSITSSMRRGY